MTIEQEGQLLQLFTDFISEIERRKTMNWKFYNNQDGFYVQCYNGTRNFIEDIPTSHGVIALWNTKNPEIRVKEIRRYCIEDDERYTQIIWKFEYIGL